MRCADSFAARCESHPWFITAVFACIEIHGDFEVLVLTLLFVCTVSF